MNAPPKSVVGADPLWDPTVTEKSRRRLFLEQAVLVADHLLVIAAHHIIVLVYLRSSFGKGADNPVSGGFSLDDLHAGRGTGGSGAIPL